MTVTETWRDWSCTVRVGVDDPAQLEPVVRAVRGLMARVEQASSRFRADSELSRCNGRAGHVTPVSPLFLELVETALKAAEQTHGAVDPTVGAHLVAAGYDQDIAVVRARPDLPTQVRSEAPVRPDHHAVMVHTDLGLVGVPKGMALDLGATAKAWTADRAAQEAHARTRGRVLVEIGGDVAVAGADLDPFVLRVAEQEGQPGECVEITHGGLTTSTTTVRRWQHHGQAQHHVIDPATGRPVRSIWRTATVWAPSAVIANTWSTAALVMSEGAIPLLTEHAPATRLTDQFGVARLLAGWPTWEQAA